MSLRRLKPCFVPCTITAGSFTSSKRFQSSTTTTGGSGGQQQQQDLDIEAELRSAQQQDFSKIRDSLLGSKDTASVYSPPSAQMQAAGSGFEDPAMANSRYTRLFIENVVDTDPLGGQHRSDYYRDPSAGYAPRHAPRNYGVGGSIDAHHPLSSIHYDASYQMRSDRDHELQQSATEAAQTRAALLRNAQREGGLQSGVNRFSSSPSAQYGGEEGGASSTTSSAAATSSLAAQRGQQMYQQQHIESADPSTAGFFETAASPRTARNHVSSWQNQQQQAESQTRLSWMDAQSVSKMDETHAIAANREAELELFRGLHGQRDRERFEEARSENFVQNNKIGYDVDRINARAKGKSTFRGLQNLVPPASSAEAQSELRRNNISSEHATYQEQAASNTTAANPMMGESLTRHLVETADVRDRNARREMIQDWHQKTGRGRQNPLVSDGGPDARTQQLGKNDERLLRAAAYEARAYVKSDSELRNKSPYLRRDTSNGVGHLLDNNFDRRRRADHLAEGKQDPIERSHMHLGQPMREQIDERVRFRSNNRPQRPIEYFLPHPKQSDMLQLQAYSDVEGFALFAGRMANTRLNTFEWDLFIRYRAHFAQRRDIALKHGLEPRPNESVSERAARREALDQLCEQTPFDAEKYMVLDHGVTIAPVDELRQWFGAYWLPSPTLCALMLGKSIDAGVHLLDEKRPCMVASARSSTSTTNAVDKVPLDNREHVLSGRYLNKLLTIDTFNTRIGRQNIKEQFLGRSPEPEILYRVSGSTLRHFSPEQRSAYEEYVKIETEKHIEKWNGVLSGRRFLPQQNCHGRLMKTYTNDVTALKPYDSASNSEENVVLASAVAVHEELDKVAREMDTSKSNKLGQERVITLDGQKYYVIPDSTRAETFVDIKTERGATITMLQSEWNLLPEEHSPAGQDGSLDVNSHLNFGAPEPFTYNRLNYVETQDTLWENRVASGEEGWTPALHSDGLKKGLPLRARRSFESTIGSDTDVTRRTDIHYGDFERATIFNYDNQPFYNPDPKEVTVVFHDEATPVKVPLANTQIWQVQWSGQERTQPLRTYKLGGGMRRFVNMQDPKGENEKKSTGDASHFLDKYLTSKQHMELSAKWRYSKSVADIDKFTTFDINRPHNHRLISGTGVRHYVRSGFLHRYTPWEFILTQEAEAPIVDEQLRGSDSTGPSMYFSPNRFWRFKRRPYGYIKNHPNEVRDLFQYVDSITPWEKAKQIRTHWEVREHHPMPAWQRPALGVHRNQAKLLPAHLWESDKKTGKVKVLKDSLKDYKPLHVHPTWTHM